MKLISSLSIVVALLSSCSAGKTVYISNKTGSTITLLIDSSYVNTNAVAFTDSLNGLMIEEKKFSHMAKANGQKMIKVTRKKC